MSWGKAAAFAAGASAAAELNAQIRNWPKHDHPGWGWAALFALVAAVDLTSNRTMSDVFREASRNPVTGPFVVGGWTYLTLHLLGFLPPQYDILHQVVCPRSTCPHVRSR